MLWRRLLLLLLLLLLLHCTAAKDRKQEVLKRIQAVDSGINSIQFTGVSAAHDRMRAKISEVGFPVESFDRELADKACLCHGESLSLAQKCEAIRRKWTGEQGSDPSKSRLLDDVDSERFLFARIQLEEVRSNLEEVVDQAKAFLACRRDLDSLVDIPKDSFAQKAKRRASEYIGSKILATPAILSGRTVLELTVPLIVTIMVILVNRCVATRELTRISVALVGLLIVVSVLSSEDPDPRLSNRSVVEILALASKTEPYIASFAKSLNSTSDAVSWLIEYCSAVDLSAKTVLQDVARFSEGISKVANAPVDNAEEAMSLVTNTGELFRKHREELDRHAAARRTRGAPSAELDSLSDKASLLQAFLQQIGLNVYSNLAVGYMASRYVSEQMGYLFEYVADGNLGTCVTIMASLHAHYTGHLAQLSVANSFVRNASSLVHSIRREGRKVQPSFASEEMQSWAMKWALRASTITALAPASIAFAPSLVVSVPIAAIGLGIAYIGFDWSLYRDSVEKECRAIVGSLSKLEEFMSAVESNLTSYESSLIMIMEDVRSMMRSVNDSQIRFRAIGLDLVFSGREKEILETGIRRVKDAAKVMENRYESAMKSLFNTMIQQAAPVGIVSDSRGGELLTL